MPQKRSIYLAAMVAGAGALAFVLVAAVLAFVFWPRGEDRPSSTRPDVVVNAPPQPPPWPAPDADIENKLVPDAFVGPNTIRAEFTSALDAVGNAKTTVELKASKPRVAAFRERLSKYLLLHGVGPGMEARPPKAKNFLGMLDAEGEDSIVENIEGEFTPTSIRAEYHEVGAAKNRNGKWIRPLMESAPLQLVKKQRSQVITLRSIKKTPEFQLVYQVVFTLPEGARDIEVTQKPNELRYRLPEPPNLHSDSGNEPTLKVIAKPHILGALAKLYADPRLGKYWPARSVFRNTTSEKLTDYRVSFRIRGFAEKWSDWSKTDSVYPGQTVVDSYRPILDFAKIATIETPTPVDIEVKCEYTRADGKKSTSTRTVGTRILAMNDGVYSDVRYDGDTTWLEAFKDSDVVLASFVVPNDPIVREVVELVGRSVGVQTPLKSDKDAMLFLKGLWMLMRTNIKYELTGGSVTDGLLHQYLMYARDVLRAKGALCVNTSIFLATVAESAGLRAYIVVIPGHAFPKVQLPESLEAVFIESTFVGGGTLLTSGDFGAACKKGAEEAAEAQANQLFIQADIRFSQEGGVAPAELPPVEPGMLAKWGITMPARVDDEQSEEGSTQIAPKGARATVKKVRLEEEVVKEGRTGALIHLEGAIVKAKKCPCMVYVAFFDEEGQFVQTRDRSVSDPDGYLALHTEVTPESDTMDLSKVSLFLPYKALPMGRAKQYVGIVLIMNDGRVLNPPEESSRFVFER